MHLNSDKKTIEGFGDEWERFDQSRLGNDEHQMLFNKYFSIFPWHKLSENSTGFDMGCGSGRWAKLLAKKVGVLHCFDPSTALEVARRNLRDTPNCVFHAKGVGDNLLPEGTQDFGVSLGVLHHVPNTAAGIKACVNILKPKAPFLIYLYYALDNRGLWFRILWKMSNLVRRGVSKLPHSVKYVASQLIALLIYFPMARLANIAEHCGASKATIDTFPLSTYRNLSFYTMRTDALDRFGTRLEHRFSKQQIKEMMEAAGLEKVVFSDSEPFWCAVGYRRSIAEVTI
jgi:SAM-dependent methyltransferase